jgi:ABC-type branched-subunit amino acid transport system substrate-binding protein/Tfp pilus assembly protein PilF
VNRQILPRRIGTLLCLALALVAVGCLQTVAPTMDTAIETGPDEARLLFERAEGYYRNRFYDKANQAFVDVVERYPETDFAAPSLYKLGGIHLKKQNFDKAVLYFDKLASEYPKSRYAVEAEYNKGFCYLKMGDPNRAIEALKGYLVRADARNKERARIYLAEAEDAVGDYERALIYYAKASSGKLDKDDQVEILSEVQTIVDQRADEKTLIEAEKNAAESHVTDYLRYRLALISESKDANAEALERLKRIDFGRARYSFYKEAQKLMNELTGDTPAVISLEGTTYTVGVLLPLSGRYGVFGEQVLHGVMMGIDFFAERPGKGVKIRVVVKDTEGDPEVAAGALRDLAADSSVLAVIGPLMKKTSHAAALVAEEVQIPLLTLTTEEKICSMGPWVFRNAVTLSAQVKSLIRYAHEQKGCSRFAILHPSTGLGEIYAELFAAHIDPLRNDITSTASYEAATTDFKSQIASLKGGGSFDALFLPDDADKVALIAPQLVYYGIKGEVLLGIPAWNDHILAKKAGSYLEDTVIVDAFFADSEKPGRRAFSNRYEEDFGERPTHLSGTGYDTVTILGELFANGRGEGRGSVRTGLLGVREFPGVTGDTTFMENGDVDKSPTLLRVGENGIEELF